MPDTEITTRKQMKQVFPIIFEVLRKIQKPSLLSCHAFCAISNVLNVMLLLQKYKVIARSDYECQMILFFACIVFSS